MATGEDQPHVEEAAREPQQANGDASAHEDPGAREPPPNGAHGGSSAHDSSSETRRGRLENLSDIVRRTFYAGLGAVFTTEEGIRKLASELKLPKDVANYLIQSAASSKDELFRVVGGELRSFLEQVNISGELQKLLTSLSFEIKTEIRFIPNDQKIGGIKPDVKVGRMSFRRKHEKRHGDKE